MLLMSSRNDSCTSWVSLNRKRVGLLSTPVRRYSFLMSECKDRKIKKVVSQKRQLHTEYSEHTMGQCESRLVLIFLNFELSLFSLFLSVVCLISPSLNSCLRYCLVTSTMNTWYSQMDAAIFDRLCRPEPPTPTSSMLPLS